MPKLSFTTTKTAKELPDAGQSLESLAIAAAGFFLLTVVWLVGYLRLSYVFILTFLIAIGLSIELIQGWALPSRNFDPGDFLMDAVGVRPNPPGLPE